VALPVEMLAERHAQGEHFETDGREWDLPVPGGTACKRDSAFVGRLDAAVGTPALAFDGT
jgi:hypothetical protein